MTKRSRSNTGVAPMPAPKPKQVLPYTEVTLDGKIYKACFDYDALGRAETALIARGHHDANLLYRMPHPSFDNVRVIFAVSLLAYQPELSFEDAKKLVTPKNIFVVTEALYSAWNQSMPEKEKGSRPPEPGE